MIMFSTAHEVSAMDANRRRSVLLAAASTRCGYLRTGNESPQRERGARARWPVDAAGPRTTTRTWRRNAYAREVVALRPWTTAHQNARPTRCALAHRAHRPYRHDERFGSLEEDPERLRGCAHLLPRRDVGPTVPAGTFGSGTAPTWAQPPSPQCRRGPAVASAHDPIATVPAGTSAVAPRPRGRSRRATLCRSDPRHMSTDLDDSAPPGEEMRASS